jgi:hypothetical protein
MSNAFLDALGADGPAADRAGKMDLYGRLIGSWDLDVMHIAEDRTVRRRKGEWHFGWALEGRAIQDVWIVPPRGELRQGDAAASASSYGTDHGEFLPVARRALHRRGQELAAPCRVHRAAHC